MIVIRGYGRLFRAITKCILLKHNARDLLFLLPNLSNNNYVGSLCETSIYMHTLYNQNNVKAPKYNNHYDVEDVESIGLKEKLLSDHIDSRDVDFKLITSIIEDLEENAYNVSESLGLKLLSCCGNVLYTESLKVRQELTNRAWTLLKKKNCNLTIGHYHQLLQSYIDNDYRIDPKEFLRNMTVQPEHDTYCLLLRVLPSSNDCKVAESLITDVHKAGLLCDEKIYNSLIYAFSINGDAKRAKRVIELMEEQGIQPSATTYMHLMYAFAKNNDIRALIESLVNYKPATPHVMKLIKLVCLSGNGINIPEILSYVEPLTGEEVEEASVKSVIVQLVHAGHSLDAYQLVTGIPLTNQAEHARITFVFFLLQEMIKVKTEPSIVLKVLNNLSINHDISKIFHEPAFTSLIDSNEALAVRIFHEMKRKGISLSCDYFWPLFLNGRKSGEETNIYLIVKHMRDLDVKIDCRTFTDYIFPYIDTNDLVSMADKMKQNGVSIANLIDPLVKFFLTSNRLKDSLVACNYLKKCVDCQDKLDSIVSYYIRSKDIDSCINFLFKSCYNGKGFAATFLKKLLEQPQHKINETDIMKFLIAMKYYKAMIAPNDVEHIQEKIVPIVSSRNKDVLKIIFDLSADTSSNYNFGPFVHPEYMNPEQLYSHLHELKSKGKNCRGVLRKLLLVFCNQNDARVNEVIEEIRSNNFQWTPGMKLTLFDYYIRNKMIEDASSVLREVRSSYPEFKIDNFKIIRFVKLLIEHDKLDEAIDTIRKCTVNQKTNATNAISDLLSFLITKDTSNYTEEMIDLLIKHGYSKQCDYMLKYLVLSQISRGDIESAIHAFKNCAKRYKKTPMKLQLLIEVMKSPSIESWKKSVFEQNICHLITKYNGTDKANAILAVALAVSNRTQELEQLFKKNRISGSILSQQLLYLPKDTAATAVSRILESLKDTGDIDLSPIHNLAKHNDCDKHGSDIETNMKEKDVKFSVKTDNSAVST